MDDSLVTSTSSPNSAGGTTTVYKYFQAGGGALESDNSILVAGSYVTRTEVTTSSGSVSWTPNEQDLALVHYLANGTRDMSFGTNGIAILPITPTGVATSTAMGSNVLIQPNGSIVEVGTATGPSGYSDTLLARFNSNGSPDTTFGGVGYVLVDLGTASKGFTAALQPNGQIVAAGLVATSFNQYGGPLTWGFATERLNTDGSLDTAFGTGGAVVTQVEYDDDYTVAVGLETINGQTMIVDAGTASNSSDSQVIAVSRYTPNGTLDSGTAFTPAAALAARTSAALPAPSAVVPSNPLADPAPRSVSTGPSAATPAAPSIIPGPGLIAQSLEDSASLDTMLPDRRQR